VRASYTLPARPVLEKHNPEGKKETAIPAQGAKPEGATNLNGKSKGGKVLKTVRCLRWKMTEDTKRGCGKKEQGHDSDKNASFKRGINKKRIGTGKHQLVGGGNKKGSGTQQDGTRGLGMGSGMTASHGCANNRESYKSPRHPKKK